MFGFLPYEQQRVTTLGLVPNPVGISTLNLVRLVAPDDVDELSIARIDSLDEFEGISEAAADVTSNGRQTKFLIDWRTDSHRVYFMNCNYRLAGERPYAAQYHYDFAVAVLDIADKVDEFNAATYFTQDKKFVAGTVHSYHLANSVTPLLGLQFYPQDVISETTVVSALSEVKAAIAIQGVEYAFVPMGLQQKTTPAVKEQLAALGLGVMPIDQILGDIDYVPLNRGEAWGHLRIFPASSAQLEPTDIPVFDQLPLDLSVVAGVITKAIQDTNSHVNLKSKERDTPNAVLRSAARDHARLAPFADKPVHFVVGREDFVLEQSSDEEVAEKRQERLNRPLTPLHWEPEHELRSFDEMTQGSTGETLRFARRYGAKAANLAFLSHRKVLGRCGDGETPSGRVGYDLMPAGFGVPFQGYRDFVDHPPNSELKRLIERLVEDEQAGALNSASRAAQVREVQSAFMIAEFPPGMLEESHDKIEAVMPGSRKVKIRSSANAEDIPGFDGAGLYDSLSAKPHKSDAPDQVCTIRDTAEPGTGDVKREIEPNTVACAVKGVYASLWNRRAIDERSTARIDQSTVAMGLAIVPAYDLQAEVAANAVIVTRIVETTAVFGYKLSFQLGNNLVTNPDPGTDAESVLAAFYSEDEPIAFTVLRYAMPAAGAARLTAPILATEQMEKIVDLTKIVERAYCFAKGDEYFGGNCEFVAGESKKKFALDLEVKILETGEFVFKQVRQFSGNDDDPVDGEGARVTG